MAKIKKPAYSKLIGLKKTLKNIIVTFGLPALLVILNHWTEIVPKEYVVAWAPIIGAITYYVKNYVENK